MTADTSLPIACALSGPAFRERREAVQRELFAGRLAAVPETDGYRFGFPPDDVWLERIMAFVVAERQCCPFLTFRVNVPAGGSGVELELSGPPGSRAFIEQTFLGVDATP